MRIWMKNRGISLKIMTISLVIAFLLGAASCHQDSGKQSAKIVDDSSSEKIRIAQENEKKAQEAAVDSLRIAEQAQTEAKTAQQLAETAQKETQSERQFSAFLKGFCISLAVVALIVGTALGSKARKDSKVRRR